MRPEKSVLKQTEFFIPVCWTEVAPAIKFIFKIKIQSIKPEESEDILIFCWGGVGVRG
jgi:hypothetical protein